MSDDTSNTDTQPLNDDDLRREILIGRVIDGEASPEDWDALRALAEQDPEIWSDLNRTQRQQELLCSVVTEVSSVADEIEIDDALVDPAPMVRRVQLVGSWGGWAAAAALALFWALGINPLQSNTGGQVAGPFATGQPELTPDDALNRYLDTGREAGRVIREVPDRVVVRAAPLDGGQQVEVFYLRQILEREIVNQVYRETVDEMGNQLTVPVRLEQDTSGGSIW